MVKFIFRWAPMLCLCAGVFCYSLLSAGHHDKEFVPFDNSDEGGDRAPCDPSSVTTYKYLMTFQACTSEECNNPQNHMVYLAGSDDGVTWSMIDELEPFAGSVPALVFYNNSLYIFHTSGASTFNWHKLNACFEEVDKGSTLIAGTGSSGFVDPSMIVSGEDLIMFYLPGTMGADPATCAEFPCTKEIHSAVCDDGDVQSFTQYEGNRVSMYIEDSEAEIRFFCDPDILELNDGSFLLYVSTGGGTVAYQSTSLSGSFVSPDDPDPRMVSSVGGVPGALQTADGSVWLYVNRNNTEGGTSIARGVSSDGITTIDANDFTVVIDSSISDDFTSDVTIGSPSVITWPVWSEESTTTSTIMSVTTTTTLPQLITTTTVLTTTSSLPPKTCLAESLYGRHSQETALLREFRDKVLHKSPEGQELTRIYYTLSSVLVKALEEDEEFRDEVKELIDGVLPLIR